MKPIPTNTRALVVALSISILVALLPTEGNAFAVHAQTARLPFSRMRDSIGNARDSIEKHRSSLRTIERHHHRKIMPTIALSAASLPGIGQLAAAAFIPGCLGLWRRGYAVSYGYGGAMLASGLIQLFAFRGASRAILPLQLHAAVYVFYGVRLCGFLLNREIRLPVELNQMKRRDASLSERSKRLPVIAGCSVLYFWMAAGPMRALALANPRINALRMATLAVGFMGFSLAAVGDWYKSKIKARDGPRKLVVTGPFRYLRHPNYTGEMIGWTCLCLLLPLMSAGANFRRAIPWLIASIAGWVGMVYGVLMEATAGLERKQMEKYGGTPEYEEWIESSWSGPKLGGNNEE